VTAIPETREDLDYRPSYRAAAIASALVFLLYLLTLSPSTAMWDTSEYIAAAYTFGLPHPPGNPFFVLLGRFFAILPIAPNVAMRINILAALCSAGAAGMWFLITERVLVGWLPERWQRIVGGSLAALIGATAFTVWAQSVVNEKVYTVSLLGLAVVSWLIVRWCDDPDGPKADRLLVLIAYLSGLGYANHMAGFLALPAVAADWLRDDNWRELHVQQGDLRSLHVQLQPRAVRQAGADAATGSVRSPGGDVVAVFPLAVAARSIRQPSRSPENARDVVPPPRRTWWLCPLEA